MLVIIAWLCAGLAVVLAFCLWRGMLRLRFAAVWVILLLSASFLLFGLAYQLVFAAVYLFLVVPSLAWVLVAYAGNFPAAVLTPFKRTGTDWVPKNVAHHLAKFLWAVVFSGLTSILSVVAVCNLLPLSPVDRIALMVIAGPLVWGTVLAWMLIQHPGLRLRIFLAVMGLSALVTLIRWT